MIWQKHKIVTLASVLLKQKTLADSGARVFTRFHPDLLIDNFRASPWAVNEGQTFFLLAINWVTSEKLSDYRSRVVFARDIWVETFSRWSPFAVRCGDWLLVPVIAFRYSYRTIISPHNGMSSAGKIWSCLRLAHLSVQTSLKMIVKSVLFARIESGFN